MVKSVVNEIIQGIANKIALLYKDKGQYPIYTDRKLQNLEKPCFFIKVLNGEEKKEIAIKMIHEKIDEEIISKVTNLSLDEIEKLKEEINIK